MHERADLHANSPVLLPLSLPDSGPHHGHYITIIKAQGSWVVFDDDGVETIKESEIPKYYGEGSSGAYVLFYQAVDMDREALGLPPDLPTPSTAEVVNEGAAVGGAAAIVVDPASPPPDAPSVLPKDGEEVTSPSSLPPNAKGPVSPLKLDLPPPALNTSPAPSPVLPESVSKANTPGLSKGAAGFFQSLRHSTSSKASMAKEKEAREKEKEVIPPVPPAPLLNGDLHTNGHAHPHANANGIKEKEGKEGGAGNIFRRSLKVTKKREQVAVHTGSGSPALPASPRLPSSIPPSPNDHRRPSGPQGPFPPTSAADETNVVPPPLPLPVASLPLERPTRGSTVDDTNATASMSSSWTSASLPCPGPGPGPGPGPLSPVVLPPPPFSPQLSLAQDSELPLPAFPPDRVPSPAGSSSGRTGAGAGVGPGAGVANPKPGLHSRSYSSDYPSVLGPLPVNATTHTGNHSGQLIPPSPWADTTSVSTPGPSGGPWSASLPTRTFKISGGGEAKKQKAVAKATEDTQAREREREKKTLEEKTRKLREEREKQIRLEEEKEKEQQQQQQQTNKPQKRASRKMSFSGSVVGRLGASLGWSKDKDKHTEKDKDKGATGMPSLPGAVRRGSQQTSNEAELDLPPPPPPERVPAYLAIGASPRFNF